MLYVQKMSKRLKCELIREVYNHPRALVEYEYRLKKYRSDIYSVLMDTVNADHLYYVAKKYNLLKVSSPYSKEIDDATCIFNQELIQMDAFVASFLQQKDLDVELTKRGGYDKLSYVQAKVAHYNAKTHQIKMTIGHESITMCPYIFWGGLDWGWFDTTHVYSISATEDIPYAILNKFGGFVWFVSYGASHLPLPMELIKLIQNYVFTKSELPVKCEKKEFGGTPNRLVYSLKNKVT